MIWVSERSVVRGIDATKMPYASWCLLNEALSCFEIDAHIGALACLVGSIDAWLREATKSDKKTNLRDVISKANEIELISNEEARILQGLRKNRNSYIHFDREKLPKVRSVKQIAMSHLKQGMFEKLEQVNPHPTVAHKDLIPLLAGAEIALNYLEEVLTILRRHFPYEASGHFTYVRIRNMRRLDKALAC